MYILHSLTHIPIQSQVSVFTQPGKPGTVGSNPRMFSRPNASWMGVPQLMTGQSKITQENSKSWSQGPLIVSIGHSDKWVFYSLFEQISCWNEWTEHQGARMLSVKLRGETQKLLSRFSYTHFRNYATLKHDLFQRFISKERELTYRSEFRNRRCMVGLWVCPAPNCSARVSQRSLFGL